MGLPQVVSQTSPYFLSHLSGLAILDYLESPQCTLQCLTSARLFLIVNALLVQLAVTSPETFLDRSQNRHTSHPGSDLTPFTAAALRRVRSVARGGLRGNLAHLSLHLCS